MKIHTFKGDLKEGPHTQWLEFRTREMQIRDTTQVELTLSSGQAIDAAVREIDNKILEEFHKVILHRPAKAESYYMGHLITDKLVGLIDAIVAGRRWRRLVPNPCIVTPPWLDPEIKRLDIFLEPFVAAEAANSRQLHETMVYEIERAFYTPRAMDRYYEGLDNGGQQRKRADN